ncbi:valine--tRNA ligase [Methylocella sp. CPCC 101449]|uniref:valine--tRNA ligase n=1 Tax=Methylocella sp. CPCC 101449 TaxID=2987531 RepID=UPI00288DD119|nr:valine--tRNA ligase [Methylocella sp. CPCC 101449]MDT2022008.1 valine--tRNA ligase [Methylocella sp. CPCC 101449]
MMDKTFDPGAVENRVARAWDEAQAFKAGRPERADAPPFSIVIPPPNVTGSLHMGHALNNTLQDILARFERMRGKDVLWQPGTDHAGIATQMVVERQLAERQQPGRRDMGREAFLEKVWEWKAESGGAIVNQLKRLGASCDWSRERFTMDEGLSQAVVKVFVELYRQGLIYKDKRLVNWDPKLLTAVSDIEVLQVETKGNLWHFNYPVEGEIYDPENPLTFITVATTRPETMLGDTAVAVHPENVKLGHFIGRRVVLPLVGRTIPVVSDTYADPEKGTGAVKITPAHDFNDFEVGRRHNLPLINIFDQEAKLILRDNADFLEGVPASADLEAVMALDGKDRFEARKLIVAMMQERDLCPTIEPNVHAVPHGDRSNVVIEPWLTDQWYVDAKTLAQPAIAAVRDGRTQFIPKNWEKTFFEWLENIQPWCISRQLWWGHQIPAWYSPWGGIYVAESEEDAVTQALADAVTREVYDDVEAGRIAQDPDQWKTLLTRDEDVLDTWFSSALWPFSTLGWPGEDETFVKRFYPTSVLVTGFDIIFFWVARMMMMGLHFMDEIPFRDVYMHALVRDEKGAKMSKSKGNVIDPLNLIDTYGADALRFTLAAMAAQGRDIKLATQRVEGYRNFATKLWNASRFAEMNGCARVAGFDPAAVQETLNKWIIGELARATGEVTTAIETYRFNEAAAAVYRFVWNIFCDWYLELGKPVLQGAEDGAAKTETRATTAYVIDEIAKLLHPFMPFITEELWAIKGAEGPKRESVLALAAWPSNVIAGDEAAEAEIGFVVDLVSEVRSVRAEMNVPAGAQMPLVLAGADAEVRRRAGAWDATIKRLARLSEISFADAPPPESAQMIVRGVVAALPLAGIVDLAAEKTRLTKEIAKEEGEVRRVDAKLNNADFVRRAPEEVVEENRERREEALSRIGKLKAALERLQ